MDYALTLHRTAWLASCHATSATAATPMPSRMFALVDWMQLPESIRQRHPLEWRLPGADSVALFAGCFAEPALTLSPLLIALDPEPEQLAAQVEALDRACHTLPILSLLETPATLAQLTRHLQALLRIEADGTPYLLRLADTQMLAAAESVLTPAQRAGFFADIVAWWAADHQGQVHNLASGPRTQPAAALPITLDASQTAALLSAAALPMLASQMRHFEEPFGQTLSHAQQMAFVHSSVMAAHEQGMQDEEQLLDWTLQRWQAHHSSEPGAAQA